MKKSIFLMFIFLLVPLKAFAANDVSISCSKTKLKINEETTCKINANNLNFNAIDVTGKIKLGSNLQLVSSSYDKGTWLSLDNKFSVTDINLMRHSNEKVNSITIATFKIKASDTATGESSIEFNNIALGNSEYQSVSLSCSPVKINFGSNINTLESLSIKGFDIKFTKDNTNYTIDTEENSIVIEATATDNKAKISGTGKVNVPYGNNTINVTVTAENGSKKTYKINTKRKDERSNINDLLNITLNHGKINFSKNQTEYVVNVGNEIENIDITYELADKKSTVEFIGNNNLTEGENTFIIKVKAENESIKEYKIKIIRESKSEVTPSNKISNIQIKNLDFTFDKNISEYTINTNYEKLDFEILLEDEESKYEIIGNENLKDGSIILIKVTDKFGNINTYKISIQNNTIEPKQNKKSTWLIIILILSIIYNVYITTVYLKEKNSKQPVA